LHRIAKHILKLDLRHNSDPNATLIVSEQTLKTISLNMHI